MKQTGVVRKIDELGRIVLPKEIRRNLGIKDGESLEIFVDEKGVYLQKYSKISNLKEISKELCIDIFDVMKINVLITNRDQVIASSKKELENIKIGKKLDILMKERESYESKEIETLFDNKLTSYFLMKPIIVAADCLGMIIFYKDKLFEEWERMFINFLVTLYIRKIEIN